VNDLQRHDKSPDDEQLNPYRAPESAQEPAADQILDFASRKRRKLIQLLILMAIMGFLTGILPEDSSIDRVTDLASAIGMAMLIVGWCDIDREERHLDRWRYFVLLMVFCPGPLIVLPTYLFVTRGVGGFAATAKATAFFGLMIFVGAVTFVLGLLLTGRI
jgi:hypothetical protein